jgi:hypothetical protein
LKALLKTRQECVMQTLIERMLTYALGRPVERFDRSTVRQIGKNLAADLYHAQTLIREIALSLPFRYKRNPTVAATTSPTKPTAATNVK